jgi:hypothetical protein
MSVKVTHYRENLGNEQQELQFAHGDIGEVVHHIVRRGPADPGYLRGWGPLTRPPFSKEMFPEGGYA